MSGGRVEAIHLASRRGAPPEPRDRVAAVSGAGLEGDRHFGRGGHDLTLIEAEAIDGLAADSGIRLGQGESRRNVLTRGIALNELVGRRFRVGEVECVGEELCEPCGHLEGLTVPGVLRGLVHRGGLCARVVEGGEIAVGDRVTALD